MGPSGVEGFIKIMSIGKNGILYPPDQRRSTNIAGFVLIERYEIYDEGLSPRSEWPHNLKEAIIKLKKEIGEPTVSEIKQMSKKEFDASFISLGQYIRNQFGLWRGNKELLLDVDSNNPEPDHVSGIIIDKLYEDITTKN